MALTSPVDTAYKSKVFKRLPTDDDELYWTVRALWGTKIPRHSCCPEHTPPFKAFADAYFARDAVAVWKASRGLGGKSKTLATLSLTEAALLGAGVTLLGGSGAQSVNIHQAGQEAWAWHNAPTSLLKKTPTIYSTTFRNNGWIRSLTASQTSVRGPHPARLRLDEIDEMDHEILKAAQGQPMRKRDLQGNTLIETNTVMSSTHQYPDKTMKKILDEAAEKGWPVHEWCIAEGSMVTTDKGQVPIELVGTDDLVLTRQGWRSVQHTTKMGVKETIILTFDDGRKLRCTPDHLVHTPGGWVTADSALSVTSIRSDVPVGVSTTRARVASDLVNPGTALVLGTSDQFKMLVPDTGRGHTDVIELEPDGDGSIDGFPYEFVCDNGEPFVVDFDSLPPVPGFGSDSSVKVACGVHTHHSTVVSVERATPVAVWDIGVHGEHEFFVNGLLVHNCYKCTSNPIDGWLAPDEVDRKRGEISTRMWETEYDLQEPSFEGRSIDTDLVEACFRADLGVFSGDAGSVVRIEDPPDQPIMGRGPYVTGVDWAKEKDWTVVATFRTDVHPWRCVAWKRYNRQPWPRMVNRAEAQWFSYGGKFIHDSTGIGNVIADMLTGPKKHVTDQTLNGAVRSAIFNEYIAGIENKGLEYPRIEFAYNNHKYVRDEDLFTSAGHPPDDFIAGSLAWSLRDRKKTTVVAIPQGVAKESAWYGK
jgi:hypothetical protein